MAQVDNDNVPNELENCDKINRCNRDNCGLKWKPTSAAKLASIEEKILNAVKSDTERRFVELQKSKARIWTVVLNKNLPGVPLVMVHGMGGGLGMWVLNLDYLAQKRPVYTFDLLGFGRSSRPTFSKNAEEAEDQFVESLEEWRQENGLEKFILLGHSLGGFVSSSYAIRYPERVHHLIAVDPWGYPAKPDEVEINAPLWARTLFKILKPFNPFSAVRAAGPLGPHIIKRFRRDLQEKFAECSEEDNLFLDYIYHCNAQAPSGEIAAKTLQTMVRWAKNPMIHRITDLDPEVPMTFIHGEDSWIPKQSSFSVKYLRSKSYVDIQTIEEAGHHVYADQPDVFNTLVLSVCDQVDQAHKPS